MAETVHETGALPVGAKGKDSVGWWGMLCLIATESSLFAYLLMPSSFPSEYPHMTIRSRQRRNFERAWPFHLVRSMTSFAALSY